jgi:hypothetical protein
MLYHGSYPTTAVHGEVEVSARSRLIIAIENYIRSRAPGYLEYLDIICKKLLGRGCADLFVDEPDKLRYILVDKLSNDIHTVYFIIKYLFLRPILIKLDKLDVEEELTSLFIQNPEKFKEKLNHVLNQ